MNSLILGLILNVVVPIQPVSYSWTLPPAPNPPWVIFRNDVCHITLRSSQSTQAKVMLYYFVENNVTGVNGLGEWVPFVAGVNKTIDREIPYNRPCPCLVCVEQQCSGTMTHTQCGYVIRPGEVVPPSWWTSFSQLGMIQNICVQSLLSDGFEIGSLQRWSVKYP